MELKGIISSTHKEIVGSRTKNRLTIQISYAIQLIMELYTTDYLILMDYIEDVSVIENPDDPTKPSQPADPDEPADPTAPTAPADPGDHDDPPKDYTILIVTAVAVPVAGGAGLVLLLKKKK